MFRQLLLRFESIWDNPVTFKEFRIFLRGKSYEWAITIFLLVLLAIALAFMNAEVQDFGNSNTGSAYLWTLISVLSLAVFVVVPSRAAASIAHEKEKRTFELLLTTLLSPREIVLGKLLYPMGLFALIFLLALPFFPLGFLLGGLSPWVLLRTAFWIFLISLFSSSAAILLSSYSSKTVSATGAVYGAVLFLFFSGQFGWVTTIAAQSQAHPWVIFGLVVLLLLWGTYFSLELAADNILPGNLRHPRYFKLLFLVGYALAFALLLSNMAGASSGNPAFAWGTFYLVFGFVHLVLLIPFPSLVCLSWWESSYVLLLMLGGLAACGWAAGTQYLPQIFFSSVFLVIDLGFFMLLSRTLSLAGHGVEKVRKTIGFALCASIILPAILSVIWVVQTGGSSSSSGLVLLPFVAVTDVWQASGLLKLATNHIIVMSGLTIALALAALYIKLSRQQRGSSARQSAT